MNELIINENSRHEIVMFRDFNHLALETSRELKSGNIALSGGRTFKKLFSLWRDLKIDCQNSTFFPVDERIVNFNSDTSNWGTAFRDFLQYICRSEDRDNFPESCEGYQQIIRKYFKSENPVFDVIFLGVGDDGHTASLFPGSNAVDDISSIVLETRSPKPPVERITLGSKVISDANDVITIIAGKEKSEIVSRIIGGDESLPIVRVLSRRKQSKIYIEQGLM